MITVVVVMVTTTCDDDDDNASDHDNASDDDDVNNNDDDDGNIIVITTTQILTIMDEVVGGDGRSNDDLRKKPQADGESSRRPSVMRKISAYLVPFDASVLMSDSPTDARASRCKSVFGLPGIEVPSPSNRVCHTSRSSPRRKIRIIPRHPESLLRNCNWNWGTVFSYKHASIWKHLTKTSIQVSVCYVSQNETGVPALRSADWRDSRWRAARQLQWWSWCEQASHWRQWRRNTR